MVHKIDGRNICIAAIAPSPKQEALNFRCCAKYTQDTSVYIAF